MSSAFRTSAVGNRNERLLAIRRAAFTTRTALDKYTVFLNYTSHGEKLSPPFVHQTTTRKENPCLPE
jgi:hypothetical protein